MLWAGLVGPEDFKEARADSEDLRATIRAAAAGLNKDYILSKIGARLNARKAKNFAESDRIRDDLLAKGIELEDKPDGTTDWRVKR
jgi:cysteinyl-tRNA synthetase